MPHIRRALLHDLSAMQMILEKTSGDWSPTILRDCFSENYLNWIIADEKKLLGFVIVKNNVFVWEIMQIVIDPLCQRKGFAKKLLLHVIDDARQKSSASENGIHTIQLEVRVSNIAVIFLYEQCGFVKIATRKKYYSDGEDAILMDLKIA